MKPAQKTLMPNEIQITIKGDMGVPLDAFIKATAAMLDMLREIEESVTGEPAEIEWSIMRLENIDNESGAGENTSQ